MRYEEDYNYEDLTTTEWIETADYHYTLESAIDFVERFGYEDMVDNFYMYDEDTIDMSLEELAMYDRDNLDKALYELVTFDYEIAEEYARWTM